MEIWLGTLTAVVLLHIFFCKLRLVELQEEVDFLKRIRKLDDEIKDLVHVGLDSRIRDVQKCVNKVDEKVKLLHEPEEIRIARKTLTKYYKGENK